MSFRTYLKVTGGKSYEGQTTLGKVFDYFVSPSVQCYLFPEVQLLRHMDATVSMANKSTDYKI